ncbi:MAG: hypothetical protein KAJ51_06245 [Thermoplasmata archaeon]|nr:hypothetical protein [Thermoplasmata archaeon]
MSVTDGKTTDSDTCQVIVDRNLAARLNIVKNFEKESISYQEGIKLNLKYRDNNSITIEVTGNITSSAVVAITLDSYTMTLFENEELIVKYDGKMITHSELINIVRSNNKYPEFNLSVFFDNIQIILYIPTFSTHTITLVKVEKPIQYNPESPGGNRDLLWITVFIIIIVIILVSFLLAYSFKRAENLKYYSKLKLDDENKFEFGVIIKPGHINWEEYDSEK